MCERIAILIIGLAALVSIPQAAMAVDGLPCRAPGPLVAFDAPLRGLARAVERSREIRVVALGSSSTEGTGASTKQAAYPARFDQEMDRRFPGKDFQVANLGKGGELADEMLTRLVRDVIPARPALVLWQTGVNDAIAGVDLAAFSKILISGIAALKSADIEVVLVDPQYYPRAAGVPRYEEYVAVMRRVARERGVPVFRRYAIMQHLIASGQHSVDGLLWEDKFHLNDTSYRCLAELMAQAVEGEIRRSMAPMKSAEGATAKPLTGWSPMAAY
ncbi:MAG: SGNH/GDSL hydrolase family protein [Hyphomicrobiaceae bacterium]